MKYIAAVQVTKEAWEAIQASFSVDLREEDEAYNEEIINKYDFRAGTNPANFMFVFEDGTRIFCDWYVEEFGGVVRWFDETQLDSLDESSYDLQEDTKFETENGDEYICHFWIIGEKIKDIGRYLMEQRTRVVNTKFGKLYIVSYWRNGELAENEVVEILDKFDRQLDYYEKEYIEEWCADEQETPQEWIDGLAGAMEEFDTIEFLLDYFCLEYDYCGTDKNEAIKWMVDGTDRDVSEVEEDELYTSSWVVTIGDYFVVVRDY